MSRLPPVCPCQGCQQTLAAEMDRLKMAILCACVQFLAAKPHDCISDDARDLSRAILAVVGPHP